MNKKIFKKLSVFLSLCIAILSINITSFASTKITSLTLTIDSDIEVGDSDSDVTVTASSSHYEVDEVEVTNEPSDEWDEGDKPKLKVTITASDGYYFTSSGVTKSSVTLKGDDGTVTSVSRKSSETLYVYITLDALEDDDSDSDYDLEVYDLEWNESTGRASWDGADDAKKYELRLYRGSTLVASSITTSNSYYNFSKYFTQSGDYTFRVRAIYSSSNKGDWEESDELSLSSSEAEYLYEKYGAQTAVTTTSTTTLTSSSEGAWLQDSIGWWYCHADKSYTQENWEYINGYWYYFNASGYMVTGWIQWNGNYYYLSSDGAMLTSTTTPDGYYVNESGIWVQ